MPLLDPAGSPRYFLRRKLHFYLTLAVIATTLFSWYNINSYCILLLLLCRLLDGPVLVSLRRAFTNKYFLAFFSLFFIELLGLLYTHDLFRAWKHIESKATLAAIPFILCAGPFTDKMGRHRLLSSFCLLLFGISCYCLIIAFWQYNLYKDPVVFFYHTLTAAVGVNAVFFSAYVVCALLYLLSYPLLLPWQFSVPLAPLTRQAANVNAFVSTRHTTSIGSASQHPMTDPSGPLTPQLPHTAAWSQTSPAIRILRVGLILFFIGMMVLLASKLLLILLIIILTTFLIARFNPGKNPAPILGLGLLVVLGIGMVVFTDNPVIRRYKDIARGDIALYQKDMIPEETVFNGVSLRLVIWKYSYEILNDKNAWLFGVTAGDSQDLLDDKYVATGINQGYLGYNFHNQFIETAVRSGLIGLAVFIVACIILLRVATNVRTREAWFTVILILLLYLTESSLEMQHSTFLSCFFPLLLLSELKSPLERDKPFPAATIK